MGSWNALQESVTQHHQLSCCTCLLLLAAFLTTIIQWCTNATNGDVRPSLENPVKYLSSQLYDGLQGW